MKCDACGAPVENGVCVYCGKQFYVRDIKEPSSEAKNESEAIPHYERPREILDASKLVSQKPSKKMGCLIIFAIFFLIGMFGVIFEGENGDSTSNQSVWKDGYTDIEDFDYYVDGNELYLKEFTGSANKVRIKDHYAIDGVDCQVVALTEGTFLFSDVESVIIPEGVRYLENNTFNSCDIKYVYLPSTLEEISSSFLGYFHDVDTIYYGGTEEQWNSLVDRDRGDIDAKQIKFEVNTLDLK